MGAASEVLAYLSAAGIRLERDGDSIIASPKSVLTDEHRSLIRARKAALLGLLTATATQDVPRSGWTIDGERHHLAPPETKAQVEARYPGAKVEPYRPEPPASPMTATEAEALRLYLSELGEGEDGIGEVLALCRMDGASKRYWLDRTGATAISAYPYADTAVTCSTCLYWQPDQVGDATGLGACEIQAPASKLPGSLWPNSMHYCQIWEVSPCRQQ